MQDSTYRDLCYTSSRGPDKCIKNVLFNDELNTFLVTVIWREINAL